MPENGPAATLPPVALETSRASLSSPSWRACDSIIRRDLIEKNCSANSGNALSAAPLIFFLIEEAVNIVPPRYGTRDNLANTSIDNINTSEFHFGMQSTFVPSSTTPHASSPVD